MKTLILPKAIILILPGMIWEVELSRFIPRLLLMGQEIIHIISMLPAIPIQIGGSVI